MNSTEVKKLDEPVEASRPVERRQFEKIRDNLHTLLMAAQGIQAIGDLHGGSNLGCLLEVNGVKIQDIRNDLAELLEPIYESFGVEASDW